MSRNALCGIVLGLVIISTAFSSTTVPGGAVSGTWTLAGSPYLVQGPIFAQNGQTLTIEAGVEVIFKNQSDLWIDGGKLEALGAQGDSIRFTTDDASLGWNGIKIVNSIYDSRLDYCVINLVKNTYYSKAAFYVGNTSFTLSHSSIRNNIEGISTGDCNARISYCEINANTGASMGGGMRCVNYDTTRMTIISHCTINGNSTDYVGGGVEAWSKIVFCYCTFSGNSSPNGGGLHLGYGVTVDHCTITQNSANAGGGIRCGAGTPVTVISNCVISNNNGSGIECYNNATPDIVNCTISGNISPGSGGGIYVYGGFPGGAPTVTNCNLTGNTAMNAGGGILCETNANATITQCTFNGNTAGWGGGVTCWNNSNLNISQCTISGNTGIADYSMGGGIWVSAASPTITQCLIIGNSAFYGGAIFTGNNSAAIINQCTMDGNTASQGSAIRKDDLSSTVINSIFSNNIGTCSDPPWASCISFSNISSPTAIAYNNFYHNVNSINVDVNFAGYNPTGLGVITTTNTNGTPCDVFSNIYENPLFIAGPMGNFYLSQTAAGQPLQSPCVNAGDPATTSLAGWTRTDGIADAFPVDMGYHYTTPVIPTPPEHNSLITGSVSPVFANVTINLLDNNNALLEATQTSANGTYSFSNLTGQNYKVQIIPPLGYTANPSLVPVTLVGCDLVTVNFTLTLIPPTGTISGAISPAYPNLTVDLFQGSTMVNSVQTTPIGVYSFPDIQPGDYSVELVVPLGFTVNQNIVPVTLSAGQTTIINFTLTPTVISDQALGLGYWKHQVDANITGHGATDYTTAQLLGFAQEIFDHFYSNPVNPIHVPGVTYVGTSAHALGMTDLQYMLNINQGGSTKYQRACQHYLTLLLNVVSNKLGQYAPATYDNPPRTVSQAIVYINNPLLVSNPPNAASNETAKNIAETLNGAQKVAANIIPLSTPNVIFSVGGFQMAAQVNAFKLNEPSPNPFNPSTDISYQMPDARQVRLRVYDTAGRLVSTLAEGYQQAGTHSVTFDGSRLAAGVYIVRLEAGTFSAGQKMVLLK